MARKLYQYLQGQNRGKVVELTGVEPEDGVTYLTFDDGSRCNIEFAAKLNDARAFSDGKFVAEVCDRTNVWTFEDKSIKEEIRWGTLKDTGEQVMGCDPYIHGKNGNLNKARNSVKALPPRHVVTKDEMVSGAEKLKELGIDPNTPGYEEGLRNMTVPTQQSLLGKMNVGGFQNNVGGNYENVEAEGTTIGLDPTGAKAPSLKDMEEFIRSTEIYVPSNINESVEEKKVEVQQPKLEISQNVTSTVDSIMEKRNGMAKTEVVEAEQKPKYPDYQSPVYNILRSCRKKDVTVPLELNLKVPGKKIYNMIKEDFNDECLDEFFDILLAELDVTEIKRCLKESLKESYEYEEANIQEVV